MCQVHNIYKKNTMFLLYFYDKYLKNTKKNIGKILVFFYIFQRKY